MRFTVLTLADAVSVREGLMSILSGGVTCIRRPEFPAQLEVWLALAVEFTPEDLRESRVVNLHVSVSAPGGDDPAFGVSAVLLDTASVRYESAQPAQLNAPLDLRGVSIPAPGMYTVSVAIDGLPEQQLTFEALGPEVAPPLA